MPDLRLAFFDYFKFICLEADAIVMLPGWARSDGATAEMQAAKCCGVKIVNWAGQSGPAVDSVAALLEGV